MQRHILAIDPGTTESAFVVLREDYVIAKKGKIPNERMLQIVYEFDFDAIVIECMEARTFFNTKGDSTPHKVGNETYETCYWIGRFMEAANRRGLPVQRVTRGEEKSRLIPSRKNKLPPLPKPEPKSPDTKIRASLVRRFAKFDKATGKGRKKCPDVFYGFKTDIWMAFAVGVVYLDREKEETLKRARRG